MKGYDSSKNPFTEYYKKAADKYGLDAEILARQGFAESSWKADAVGKTLTHRPKGDQNAIGVAQFMPSTAKGYGLTAEDLKDPAKAIDAQGRYMADLKKQFGGNMDHALAAYNWGQGNVRNHLKKYGSLQIDKLPKETSGYLSKIGKAGEALMGATPTHQGYQVKATQDSAAGRVEVMNSPVDNMQRAETLGQRQLDEQYGTGLSGFGNSMLAAVRGNNTAFAYLQNQSIGADYEGGAASQDDLAYLREQGLRGGDLDFILKNWRGREAVSEQMALIESRSMDAQAVGRYGAVGGFLMNVAGSIADPVNLGLSMIPGGALLKGASLVGYANKSRAALIASHAAVGGVTNIIGDQLLSEQMGMESDPYVNGIVGATLGSLGGIWARQASVPASKKRLAPLNEAIGKAQDDLTARQLEAQGVPAHSPSRVAKGTAFEYLQELPQVRERGFEASKQSATLGKLVKDRRLAFVDDATFKQMKARFNLGDDVTTSHFDQDFGALIINEAELAKTPKADIGAMLATQMDMRPVLTDSTAGKALVDDIRTKLETTKPSKLSDNLKAIKDDFMAGKELEATLRYIQSGSNAKNVQAVLREMQEVMKGVGVDLPQKTLQGIPLRTEFEGGWRRGKDGSAIVGGQIYSPQNTFHPEITKLHEDSVGKSWGWRYDAIGRLLKAPNDKLRKLASGLSHDPLNRNSIRTVEEFGGDVKATYRNWAVEMADIAEGHQKGMSRNSKAMLELGDQVIRAISDTSGVTYRDAPDHVKKAVDAQRRFNAENRGMINQAKMLAFDLADDANYMYMPTHEGKVNAAMKRFGSFEKLKANLKDWAYQSVDEGYLKARYAEAKKLHDEGQAGKDVPVPYKTLDAYKDSYAEMWAATKLEHGFLDLNSVKKREGTGENPDFLEHAAKFNRGKQIVGSDGQAFSLMDITNTNIWDANSAYTSKLGGNYGVKMVYGKDINELLDDVDVAVKELQAEGKVGAADQYGKLFRDTLSNSIGVSPYASDSVFYRALATLRGAEHIKLAGGFGLNAAGEALGAVANLGMRSAMKMYSGMGKTLEAAKAGDQEAIDSLKFLERVYGHDQMRLNLVDHSGAVDDFYSGHTDYAFANKMDAVANKVNRGAQWANRITGFETFQKRTMEGLRLHLYEELKKAIKDGKGSNGFMAYLKEGRIEQYGLKQAEFATMTSNAQKFMKENGEIDIEAWKNNDVGSFYTMKTLMGRMADEMIQKHSPNDLPIFMSHPVAQTLFQFMTFPVAAFSRNTLKTFRDRDRVAALKLLGTSIGASLVYSSRMALNSLEQDDPQAYRDDKLSLDKIALVGFSRSSFASIIPSVTNSVLPFEIPGLADARTTGNSTSFLGGAVVNDVDRMTKLARAGMAYMSDEDYEFTKGDRKAARQLALPNWIGTGLVYDKIGDVFGIE